MTEFDRAILSDPSRFPQNYAETAEKLHSSIERITSHIDKIVAQPCNDIVNKISGLEEARFHLTYLYSMSSLYWVYLRSKGIAAGNHGIKQQLDLVKQGMARVKEVEDRAKAPRLNVPAAQRFIRSGLFDLDNASKTSEKANDSQGTSSTKEINNEINSGAKSEQDEQSATSTRSSEDADLSVAEPVTKKPRKAEET